MEGSTWHETQVFGRFCRLAHNTMLAWLSSLGRASDDAGKQEQSASQKNADAVARIFALSIGDNLMLSEDDEHEEYEMPSRIDSMASAFARMCVSTLAFLFQRPVRLFRPMHFSTFSLLEMMARRQGNKLGVPYLGRLLRHERPALLLSLVVPPMLANLAIGFTLFQTYTMTEHVLTTNFTDGTADTAAHPFTPTVIVAIAGAAAGAAQCVISAPLDNIRLVVQPLLIHDTGHRTTSLSLVRAPFRTWQTIMEAAVLPFLPERWYNLAIRRLERLLPTKGPGSAPTSTSSTSQSTASSALFQYLPKHVRMLARRKHGMSLILSLIRDALGFSAFFVTFEWARRCAYHASLQVDKWVHVVRRRSSPRLQNAEQQQLDQSFGASRTVFGRTTAVLTLVLGGALGAWLYSIVSRPVEYVRMVLWNRLYVPQSRRLASRGSSSRHHRTSSHCTHYRSEASSLNVRSVRVRMHVPRISFVQAERPLRTLRRRCPAVALRFSAPARPVHVNAKRMPRRKFLQSSTLSRLMRFARMTAPEGQVSSPVRLFLHTYMVRPFLYPELCKPSAPRPWGTAPPVRHAHPTSAAVPYVPAASVRRSPMRCQWIINRLLSPYACGFLVFAWMSGDLG